MANKKIKGKRVSINKNVVNKSDKQLEEEAVQEEKFSFLFLILILIGCFAVGITLGCILYKIALNSSSYAAAIMLLK